MHFASLVCILAVIAPVYVSATIGVDVSRECLCLWGVICVLRLTRSHCRTYFLQRFLVPQAAGVCTLHYIMCLVRVLRSHSVVAVSTSRSPVVTNPLVVWTPTPLPPSRTPVLQASSMSMVGARVAGSPVGDGNPRTVVSAAYIFPCFKCGNPAGQVRDTVNTLKNQGADFGMVGLSPLHWNRVGGGDC